jgi:hypothetical protein
MREFRIGDHLYRARQMNARQQFHVARRLAPLVGQVAALSGLLAGSQDSNALFDTMLMPFAQALSKVSDADCDYVLDACLSVTQRQSGANGSMVWSDVWNARAQRMQFEDIDDVGSMIQIASEVLQDNLGNFFSTAGPTPASPPLAAPISATTP